MNKQNIGFIGCGNLALQAIKTLSGSYNIFYSSATCGVFGSAAASSYILNHDQNIILALTKLNYSIQLATMNSSGIWQCRKGEGEA